MSRTSDLERNINYLNYVYSEGENNMALSKEQLQKPDVVYWPEVRWWLAEGFHTDETIKNDVKQLYEAGFGAAEFLAMGEAGADSKLYGWGSEEWVHDSDVVIKEVTKRRMGASVTSGTNWSNANLTTITPDDKAAAKELDVTFETVKAGLTRSGKLEKCEIKKPNIYKQELVAVIAGKVVGQNNQTRIMDESSIQILTSLVQEDNLNWTAPEDGDYELMTFWMHGTGQIAEPSVSISYTINYLDRYGAEAVIDYWEKEAMKPDLVQAIKENGRVMMYMDSLELNTFGKGGVFWGYHLLEEFERRRGYNLVPYMPYIIKSAAMMLVPGFFYFEMLNKTLNEKVINDFYQTLTDLYMESMLKPFQEWLHSVGMELRAEISYGMPFEISQPGKYVDGVETESLEFASQIDAYRGLAGTAHLYQHLFSSETGATMHNYMLNLDFFTQIIYTQFASGVNKTVLHGYSSIAGSDTETYWPGHEGMLPIFSERFGSRQPAFQHYNDWTDMLARYQMILRQGKPRVDIGILRLDYTFNNMYMMYGNEVDTYENKLMRANEGIYWKDMKLQNSGYTYEYFAPQILEDEVIQFSEGVIAPDGPAYQSLIIYQETMPLNSMKQIYEWAKQGLPVVIVDGVTETIELGKDKFHAKAASATPFNDGKDNELNLLVEQMLLLPNVVRIADQNKTKEVLTSLGVLPRVAFEEENKNIFTFLREDQDIDYVFVYNYMYPQKEAFTTTLKFQRIGKPYRFYCFTGTEEEIAIYDQKDGNTWIDITLMPGEATIIALHKLEKDSLHGLSSNACQVRSEHGTFSIVACTSGDYEVVFSDGSKTEAQVIVPENIMLPEWDLELEDWDEGDKVTITEDRGLGIITNEVYYTTKKRRIPVGKTTLIPWKDIAEVGPEVSGVGYYTTKVSLPSDWSNNNGALLMIESTNGNTAAIYVNGNKAPAYDFNKHSVDISHLLVAGDNVIQVEVSSTLTNRLIARNYYEEKANPMLLMKTDEADLYIDTNDPATMEGISELFSAFPKATVQDYGMTGVVELVTYTVAKLR